MHHVNPPRVAYLTPRRHAHWIKVGTDIIPRLPRPDVALLRFPSVLVLPSFHPSYTMSQRDRLIEISNRFVKWIQSREMSAASLEALVSRDVILHIPYPGVPSGFEGILANQEQTSTATSDIKVVVKFVSVDEVTSTVTTFWEASGHQTGYLSHRRRQSRNDLLMSVNGFWRLGNTLV
jgi:hypothetical protein